MNAETIIRAWKDPEFRASLSPEQLAALPESPSGRSMTELGEDELNDAVGGALNPTIRITIRNPSWVDGCPSQWGCITSTIRLNTEVINPVIRF